MPRPPRLELDGALYHLISRGNGRARIFLADDDRLRFLRQLRDNLRTYDVLLYAYVLMDNHYHLLAKTNRANLSQFMQRLNTSYALYFRYRHRRPGHLLQGRYTAKLVEDDQYLVGLSRYIHLNPVKTAAGLRMKKARRLRSLEAFRWSSYPGYVAAKAEEGWVCYDLRKQFGRSRVAARRCYRAFVQACVMEEDGALRDAMRASRYAIGAQQYISAIEERLRRRRTGRPRRGVAASAGGVGADRPGGGPGVWNRSGRFAESRPPGRRGEGGGPGAGLPPHGVESASDWPALWGHHVDGGVHGASPVPGGAGGGEPGAAPEVGEAGADSG